MSLQILLPKGAESSGVQSTTGRILLPDHQCHLVVASVRFHDSAVKQIFFLELFSKIIT